MSTQAAMPPETPAEAKSGGGVVLQRIVRKPSNFIKMKAITVHCKYDKLEAAAKLKPNPRNPRTHPPEEIESLARIIKETGWRRAVTVSKRSGLIVRGHGAVQAASVLGCPVPVEIQNFRDEAEEHAHMIADNRLAELAEWNDIVLADLLKEIDADLKLDLTGFDTSGLENMLAGLDLLAAVPEPKLDQAETLLTKWKVKRGQLWEAGRHLILCGDSTNEKEISRLPVSKCPTMIFDPEWDKLPPANSAKFDNVLAFSDGSRVGEILTRFGPPAWLFVWDCGSCWFTPSRPLKKCKLCLWFGDVKTYQMDGAHYGDAGEAREVFNSRGSYKFKPDARGKHLADVFAQPITRLHTEIAHAHSKPMDWIRLLIGNCTTGDVFDPFCGSGSTVVACEKLGRVARGVEIEPKNVAVALEWLSDVGLKPRLGKAS